jgi:topoisomerase-4 subunit A
MSEEQDNNLIPDEPSAEIKPISGLYQDWFLDYASYVILDRAVPHMNDGLKPVQRRLLHALKDLDDGRFNKVANVIGHTMKYHPHGDASIGDALVQIGQKDLLIDCQGNWGNTLTGDSAAAARYIEARLSKFANDVVFNPETTEWQLSYDGRNKEPVTLPMKFPLLLAQGAEGIAVGLSTKILPHNFVELIDYSIRHLNGKTFNLLPDFPTGGYADFSNYNEGMRGGKVKVRAKINVVDKKTLTITEIPFGTTTNSLIDSVISANDKGKIKIKKIEDNTARNVEIVIHLNPGISPDVVVDALYAFTNCEMSISPNTCVIEADRPRFVSVNEALRISTDRTKDLLKRELEIKKGHLLERQLFGSLEKIFIENRIYRDIEECETWEAVLVAIDNGLEPFKKDFYREIVEEDLVRLTEIKIKRISKFDTFKADELLNRLTDEIAQVEHHLANLTQFAIDYFLRLKDKYGKGRERKTEIKSFGSIEVSQVALANEKLYVNRADGFIGIGLKKDEFVDDCSDIDNVIIFREDGVFQVVRVSDKVFVGKGIIHIAVWKKGDERTIYNMIYRDGDTGTSYIKRFAVKSITREREYDLTKGSKGSKVTYFTANPNGEAEIITVYLKPMKRIRKQVFDFDFSELTIKGRTSAGNILTKYPVKKFALKEKGVSTLGGLKIWFDESSLRLNTGERGKFLGEFDGEDKILVIYQTGEYEITNFELVNHFDDGIKVITKHYKDLVVSTVYFDGEHKEYFVKRFNIESLSEGKKKFITDSKGSKLAAVSVASEAEIEVKFKKVKDKEFPNENIGLQDFIDVKGWKAMGNKLSAKPVSGVKVVNEIFPEVKAELEVQTEEIAEDETSSAEEPNAKKENEETKDTADVSFEITNPDNVDNPKDTGNQGSLF